MEEKSRLGLARLKSREDLIEIQIADKTGVLIEEFKEGVINHEFQSIFFLKDYRKVEDYKLQGSELSGVLKVKIDDLILLFSNKINNVIGKGIILEKDGSQSSIQYEITREKFIPTLDNYYYKIMILAKRILNSEKHILI